MLLTLFFFIYYYKQNPNPPFLVFFFSKLGLVQVTMLNEWYGGINTVSREEVFMIYWWQCNVCTYMITAVLYAGVFYNNDNK